MENKIEELKGVIREKAEEISNTVKEQVAAEKAAREEENAKYLEQNREVKARLDALQDKIVNISTKTAGNIKVRYAGYDPEDSKNFKGFMSEDICKEVSAYYVHSIKKPTEKVFDATYVIPVEYSNTLMGLAELKSVSLSNFRVMQVNAPTLKVPVKATRSTADAQSPGTANTASSMTLGQLTFTIDKYIGEYVECYNSELDDSNLDYVNQWLMPAQAEAIGQYSDAEAFNGTNSIYTSSIIDVTAAVTASGTTAIAAAITFANLNTMFHHIQWERGIMDAKWYGSRGALSACRGLTDDNGQPLLQQVPVNGRPVNTLMGCEFVITPKVADAPANGAMRLCFGDGNQYGIVLRGQMENTVNPWVKAKEHITQFIAAIRADGNVLDNATAASSGAWAVMSRVDA